MDELIRQTDVAVCNCEDTTGDVCGRVMTKEENDQDGMCWHCAGNVWNEMTTGTNNDWKHSDRVDID